MNRPPLLEFENVTLKRDEEVFGLSDFSLRIEQGEHVAILGPNGSGKSTFIKAITRELYPLQKKEPNRLAILGQEVWNIFELRPHLGIVSSDLLHAVTCAFPAREIVLSGFFGSVGVWPYHEVTPEMEARTDALMGELEIAHLAERPVATLSTGEARRVLIARALVHRPSTLLLDEPTASLDLRATRELLAVMARLARTGTSLLLVTHHLPDILPEIERVVLLKDGRLFRDGAKRDILTAPVLSDLFGIPVELLERDGHFHLV